MHENLRFPDIEVSNVDFTKLLHKATFWGQGCLSEILRLRRHFEHAMFVNLVLGIDIVFVGFCQLKFVAKEDFISFQNDLGMDINLSLPKVVVQPLEDYIKHSRVLGKLYFLESSMARLNLGAYKKIKSG